MKEFNINSNGVCTNPNTYPEGSNMFNCVKTALFPDGKWRYGYCFQFDRADYYGGSCGATDHAEGYDTEKEAALAAVKLLQAIADKQHKRGDKKRMSIDMCCEKVVDAFCQLELF